MNDSVVMRRGWVVLEVRCGRISGGSKSGEEGTGGILYVGQLDDRHQVVFSVVILFSR